MTGTSSQDPVDLGLRLLGAERITGTPFQYSARHRPGRLPPRASRRGWSWAPSRASAASSSSATCSRGSSSSSPTAPGARSSRSRYTGVHLPADDETDDERLGRRRAGCSPSWTSTTTRSRSPRAPTSSSRRTPSSRSESGGLAVRRHRGSGRRVPAPPGAARRARRQGRASSPAPVVGRVVGGLRQRVAGGARRRARPRDPRARGVEPGRPGPSAGRGHRARPAGGRGGVRAGAGRRRRRRGRSGTRARSCARELLAQADARRQCVGTRSTPPRCSPGGRAAATRADVSRAPGARRRSPCPGSAARGRVTSRPTRGRGPRATRARRGRRA